jgi:hypothetical protein
MAALGRVEREFLVQCIASARPDECRNLIAALRLEREAAVQGLRRQAEEAGESKDWPVKARLAMVALYLGESALARDMLQVEQRPDPVERTVFIKTFPTWHGDLAELLPVLEAADDPAFRSGVCCAMAGVSSDGLGPAEKKAWDMALLVSEPTGRVYAQRRRIRVGAVESRLAPDRTHNAAGDWRPLVRQLDGHDDGLDPSRGVPDGFAGFGQGS